MRGVRLPMEQLAQLIALQIAGGGVAHLTVTGGSMLPMLRSRQDMVELVAPECVAARDVILYRRENGSYILHRILSVEKDGSFLCSGDNQWEKEIVCREQILAKVTAFYRDEKRYSVEHPGYQVYTRLWVGLFAIRRPVLALRRQLGRLRRTHKKS